MHNCFQHHPAVEGYTIPKQRPPCRQHACQTLAINTRGSSRLKEIDSVCQTCTWVNGTGHGPCDYPGTVSMQFMPAFHQQAIQTYLSGLLLPALCICGFALCCDSRLRRNECVDLNSQLAAPCRDIEGQIR